MFNKYPQDKRKHKAYFLKELCFLSEDVKLVQNKREYVDFQLSSIIMYHCYGTYHIIPSIWYTYHNY